MLAYSPNKKKIPSVPESIQEYSESQENADYSDYSEEEEEKTPDYKYKPPRHNQVYPQRQQIAHKADDYHTFEELSSIRRSPHVIDAYTQEVEESESDYEESYEENESEY